MNKKVLIGIVIVVLVMAMVAANLLLQKGGDSPVFGGGNSVGVKVAEVEKGDISSYISANGIVEEVEKAEVFFETPMKVKQILVQKNGKVARGQKILELDMDSILSELDSLKFNKEIQEISLNSKAAGAEVRQAKSALEDAERTFNDSKKALEDNKALYEASAISKSELDATRKAYEKAEWALKNAKESYNTAVEARSVSRKTEELKFEQTVKSIADLEKRIQKLNESLVSPMDGVISELNVEEGAYTGSMQAAYKVINPGKLQVKANVREYDIRNVAVGQDAVFTGDAIDKDQPMKGKVTGISPVASVSRTSSGEETVVEVIISIENNAEGILKPGLNVTCDISTVNKTGVLLAPMEMLKEDKDGNKFAFVVNKETGIMTEKPIKLGISSDMKVEVLEGLQEGDTVVLDPQPMYRNGMKVRILDNEKK